jgi:predicted DNA-binding protein (UPF0251 family)
MIRRIHCQPPVRFFKPQGAPLGKLRGVTLPLEGLEAIRLADAEGMEQEQAAAMMDVSRPTFSRLLAESRRTVASALANGWAIRIDGGHYALADEPGRFAPDRRRCRGAGGRGGGRRRGAGHFRPAALDEGADPDK